MPSKPSSKKKSLMGAFREAFASKRVAVMAPLGISSGLPLVLTGSTLTAWMATEGVDVKTIGLFALVSLPYSIKFLWAPLLDRFRLPFLGRRRGWMILTQIALGFAIAAMGRLEPAANPVAVAVAALVVSFFSASQDVVVDAYRTDTLAPHERASGVAIFISLYRVALIVSGAGALMLSESLGWESVYAILGALMVIGVGGTLLAPKAPEGKRPVRTLRDAVVEPWRDFFSRPSALMLLAIAMTFKVGDAVASHMLMPFLVGQGYSLTEIGAIVKVLGLWATIVGSLVGGGLVAKFGMKRSLIAFGLLQALANALYAVLAMVGKSHAMLVTAIGVDHLFNGLGTAAFVAFLMSLCNVRFSATQYALLSSAGSVLGRLIGGTSGYVVDASGWAGFFLLTLVAGLPAILLIAWIDVDSESVSETATTS